MPSVWVDDLHPIFRRGLIACLAESDFDVVGESAELQPLPNPSLIDVLVFEAGRDRLRTAISAFGDSDVRLVAVVPAGDEQLIMDAIDLGVAGVLVRADLRPTALLTSIRSVCAGNASLPAQLVAKLLDRAANHPHSGGVAALSGRELSVLRLLADGEDTRGIAGELCYSDRTVKNIVHDVLMKMNCRNRAHAVALATRQGLI